MAAANFSRDVLENTDDLIDFETNIESTQQEEKKPAVAFKVESNKIIYSEFKKQMEETGAVPLFTRGKKITMHCDWLKISKKERCGKRCKQFYCSTHSEYINKGITMPLPCLCCGVGVRRSNQLCRHCEIKYGVEYK